MGAERSIRGVIHQFYDYWSALRVFPPTSCSGTLATCCSADDYDWYYVAIPSQTLAASVSVQVCAAINTSWGSVGFALWYLDEVSRLQGETPTFIGYDEASDGSCALLLSTQTVSSLAGGRWYVDVYDSTGVCCNPATTYAYVLEILVANSGLGDVV